MFMHRVPHRSSQRPIPAESRGRPLPTYPQVSLDRCTRSYAWKPLASLRNVREVHPDRHVTKPDVNGWVRSSETPLSTWELFRCSWWELEGACSWSSIPHQTSTKPCRMESACPRLGCVHRAARRSFQKKWDFTSVGSAVELDIDQTNVGANPGVASAGRRDIVLTTVGAPDTAVTWPTQKASHCSVSVAFSPVTVRGLHRARR